MSVKYEWVLLGNYGYGWDELTAEESREAILEQLRTYQANERGAIYKIKKQREVA